MMRKLLKIKSILAIVFFLMAFKAGDKVDIEWNGSWYRGNIKSTDPNKPGSFCVHYEGWESSYDECGIDSSRLAPLGTKAKGDTGPSSGAASGGSGGSSGGSGSYQFDYCGGKPKSSCRSDQGCRWNGSKCVKE